MQACTDEGDYTSFVALLRDMSPNGIDQELRSMQVRVAGSCSCHLRLSPHDELLRRHHSLPASQCAGASRGIVIRFRAHIPAPHNSRNVFAL